MNGVITAGPDGNLWFGYFNGDEVGTINPTTDAIAQYPVPIAQGLNGIGGPAAIAVGPDGNLWITLENANEIGAFNPRTLTVSRRNLLRPPTPSIRLRSCPRSSSPRLPSPRDALRLHGHPQGELRASAPHQRHGHPRPGRQPRRRRPSPSPPRMV